MKLVKIVTSPSIKNNDQLTKAVLKKEFIYM